MGVDLKWIDEHGSVRDQVGDPFGHLAKILAASSNLDATVCLKFIDPYGDTVFNQLQIPILIEEMKTVHIGALEIDAKEHLQDILELATKASGQVHTYLKFFGD